MRAALAQISIRIDSCNSPALEHPFRKNNLKGPRTITISLRFWTIKAKLTLNSFNFNRT
jgi:hypothetical protein